jgi:hypothetical protein
MEAAHCGGRIPVLDFVPRLAKGGAPCVGYTYSYIYIFLRRRILLARRLPRFAGYEQEIFLYPYL